MRGVAMSALTLCIGSVGSEERIGLIGQRGATIWLTGLSASGKVGSFRLPFESLKFALSQLSLVPWNNICYICTNLFID
jgi:hypothetical protein